MRKTCARLNAKYDASKSSGTIVELSFNVFLFMRFTLLLLLICIQYTPLNLMSIDKINIMAIISCRSLRRLYMELSTINVHISIGSI